MASTCGAVLDRDIDDIGITSLQHGKAGAKFVDDLDDDALKLGGFAPVIIDCGQDDFLAGGPVIQLEGAGTIGDRW